LNGATISQTRIGFDRLSPGGFCVRVDGDLVPSAPESKYLKNPTLVATKSMDLPPTFAPKPPSSMRSRLYKIYHDVFPPKRGNYSFPGRAAPPRV
jgi:hypothetical protein